MNFYTYPKEKKIKKNANTSSTHKHTHRTHSSKHPHKHIHTDTHTYSINQSITKTHTQKDVLPQFPIMNILKRKNFVFEETNFVVLKINFEYPLKIESMLPLLIKYEYETKPNTKR